MNRHIRKICRFWKDYPSRFVQLNEKKLGALAKKILKSRPLVPDWFLPGVLPVSNWSFVYHSFYACAIDFAFRHFEPPHERFVINNSLSGSAAATACCYRLFQENLILPHEILDIVSSPQKTREFFQGINLPPLLEERRACLAEAARVLRDEYYGHPLNILLEADFQVSKVIEILINKFPVSFGSDIYYYRDSVDNSLKSFYAIKRAQLWLLIYQGRAKHSEKELPQLKDVYNIGPVADYQIPKYLRSIGVLHYASELDEKIANWEILRYGSPEEMEIRFATIYAVSQLIKKTGLKMPELDYFLWTSGQEVKNLNHHLTPTTAY